VPARRAAPGDVLELFVLAPSPSSDAASILATFRSARLLVSFPRRGGEAGARWQRIIRAHERTLAVLEGRARSRELPSGRELRELGRDLFDVLFPGDVRRLYDTARALRGGGALDVVFTSMLDWVADKPWELAFDPSRREFLATSSVNFVRNAFTAVPADAPPRGRGRLRILAVVAQPRGTAPLDAKTETTASPPGASTSCTSSATAPSTSGSARGPSSSRTSEGGSDRSAPTRCARSCAGAGCASCS
jgi:hypothetical protein